MTDKRLGHYRVVSQLGEGGMGTVWKARDEKLDRWVALKCIRDGSSKQQRQRLMAEVRAISALNHPGIVTLYDLIESGGEPFVAMEFVEGETLADLLKRQRMSIPELVRIGIELAEALAAAHRSGIIHRDLKPGNIMIRDDGRIKILDFGLARREPTAVAATSEQTATILTAEGTIVGTPHYMSPEQARGESIDARSDLFSLGAILYEMATGRKAFVGASAVAIISSVLKDNPPPMFAGDLSREASIERIVMRCLRKSPSERFQTALDLRNALEDSLAQTRQLSPTQHVRRSTPWVPLGLLILLVALAGYIWFNRAASSPALTSAVVRPLERLEGAKASPSLSPDGNQVVFAWDGGKPGPRTIYALVTDTGARPLRLTSADKVNDVAPQYSPDGRWVYFNRDLGKGPMLYRVPALGGEEREVSSLPAGLISISFDGQFAVIQDYGQFVDVQGLALLNLRTGERKPVASRSNAVLVSAVFSTDSQWIYLVTETPDRQRKLERMRLDGSGREPFNFPALTQRMPSVTRIWSTKNGYLVEGRVTESDKPAIRAFLLNQDGSRASILPPNLPLGRPAVDGGRLVFLDQNTNSQLMRAPAFPRPGEPPAIAAVLPQEVSDTSPSISPDGRLIATASRRRLPESVDRDRSHIRSTPAIWIWDSNFRTGFPAFARISQYSGTPTWSPDGKMIALDARVNSSSPEIWVSELRSPGQAPVVRQLTRTQEDMTPCFDPKGEYIYFTSIRNRGMQIYRVRATGGEETQVTQGGGFTCQFSPDGAYFYYLKSRTGGGIWRYRLRDGLEEPVLTAVEHRNWKVLDDGIYVLDAPRGAANGVMSLGASRGFFYRFATRQMQPTGLLIEKSINMAGIDLTRDRAWIYFSTIEARTADLMVMDFDLPRQ